MNTVNNIIICIRYIFVAVIFKCSAPLYDPYKYKTLKENNGEIN